VYEAGTDPNDPHLADKITVQKQLSADTEMIGFGEISLLMNDKRTATVLSGSHCDCWVMSGDVLKHIIAQSTLRRRQVSLNYLNRVQIFKNIDNYEKMKLIDGLRLQTFKMDEFVIREGDTGNEFYIIEDGTVDCLKVDPSEESGFQKIRTLGEGSHFGEIAILKNVKRTLSVKVSSPQLKALVLSRVAFQRILGSIKDYLMEDYQKGEMNMMDISFESEHSADQDHDRKAPRKVSNVLPGIAEADES